MMIKHQERKINASTDKERSETRGICGRAPSADTSKGSRPDLHGRRSSNVKPEDNAMERELSLVGEEVRFGNKWVVTICSIYDEARNATRYKAPIHTKKTGHRLTTQTCLVIKNIFKSESQNAFRTGTRKIQFNCQGTRSSDCHAPRQQDNAPRLCRGCRKHQSRPYGLPGGLPQSPRVSHPIYPSFRYGHLRTVWR